MADDFTPEQQQQYDTLVAAAGPVGSMTRLALATAVMKGQTTDADILAAVELGESAQPKFAERAAAHRERQEREAEIKRVHQLGGNRAVQEHLRGTNGEAGASTTGDAAVDAARSKLQRIISGELHADGSPRNEKTTNTNRLG